MSQLVKDATANFAKFAPALAAAVEENITPLLEAGLVELLVSKLNSGTGGRAGADVIDNVISSPEIQPWDYPGLLKATVDRILKLISTKKKDDEYDALMRILSNLIWRYDGKEEDSMRGALAEAGFHNVCMVLIKEGDYDSSRMYSILINLSNTKQCAVPMVRDNCHTFIMDRMKAAPKNVWTDDLHGTDGGNAFDVATNLAKWASIRSDLIKAGYVEILAELVQYENYFGFESTEGLAYIVGRSEDAKNTKLLQAKERNVRLLFEVLEGSLNGNPVRFNITWSVYGRVLAIQSLSVSDGNKELLRPAIPLLNRVLKECSDDEDSVELALQCLLEMGLYFNEKNDTVIKDLPDILNTLAGYASSSNTKIAQYASNLKFALTPKPVATAAAASSGAAGDGWVMISYNWKSQPIVKVLNQKLKDAGIKTWIDIEQMNGDTVEKMAEAVEGAKAVIICITENYKESAPCRLEANYAFKNRKPIVPILMQEGYVPTGWLGLLIGNQLYYPIASEEAVAPIVPNILNDIAKQTGLASAADAAKKAASAVPSHSSVATSSSPSKSAGASASAASSSGPAVGGYVGASFPSDKVLNMTPEDIEKHFTSKGQQKLGAYLKKQQITGKSLAIVFDMYSRGDGSVIAICKDLGAKSTAHALEVLFIIRELCVESGAASFGPRFPSELLQKMNEIQVEQWLFSKGLPKLGTYFKKSGLKGSGLAILFDLYNRSDATLIKICHDLGTSSTVQSLQLLSLLKDISNLD